MLPLELSMLSSSLSQSKSFDLKIVPACSPPCNTNAATNTDKDSSCLVDELFCELNDVNPSVSSTENTESEMLTAPLPSEDAENVQLRVSCNKPNSVTAMENYKDIIMYSKINLNNTNLFQPKGKKRTRSRNCTTNGKKQNEKTLSRNHGALAARKSRERKKMYILSIEQKLKLQESEISQLNGKVQSLSNKVQKLEKQNLYLRSALKNDSKLFPVLQTVLEITSPAADDDCSEKLNDQGVAPGVHREEELEQTGGVCVHVSKESVSLELCPGRSCQRAKSD